jgi:superfamily II DNA or RNA helicase
MATMPVSLQVSSPARPSRRKARKPEEQPRLSRQQRPGHLGLEDWQRGLRRQFGRDQAFAIKNLGSHPVFSEFRITNPQSKSTYRVAIRGAQPGENYCSCPDFATNALGTCKHIEFTLGWLERRKGGKSALQDGYQPPFSEVYLRYGARRELCFRPGTECPRELARLSARYFDSEGTLHPEAFERFPQFLSAAGKIEHDLRCYEDALAFLAELRDAKSRKDRLAEAFPRGARSAAFRKLLKVPLYHYQKEGALFAARAGRSLIGDEMGLGKTIQALAAVEIMARHFGVEHVLIVCPTSLKHQWEREIQRFTTRTSVVIGGLRPRRELRFRENAFFRILNYDTVHADLDLIRQWAPDLVILDEAQRIKNWNTRVARSVKRIAARYAIVLTGTPLENRLEELISIVQFVDQHRLGPTYRLLHDHQIRDEHGKVIGYRGLDRIGQTLAPVLLRRQKDQVLDQLPERLEKYFFVPMTPEQRAHHEENQEIVAQVVQRWRRMKFLTEADQRRLMIALQNMRMSCDSTYLLDHESDFGFKADELAGLLDEIYEAPEIKVVVFSQWLRMHELLIRRLSKRKWEHVLFHGGVPGTQRKDLIDRFRSDGQCRAFLSTDAGGVGLNLQHASVVVNVDLPWNPAVLEQRIGRVHRLGQQRPVRVINFVSQGTIEHGMLGLLKFKKSLFSGVLDGGEKEVFLGGSRLDRFMKTVETATSRIPEAESETSISRGQSRAELPRPAAGVARPKAASRISGVRPAAEPWAELLQTGLVFLEQVAAASRQGDSKAGSGQEAGRGAGLVRRDPQGGASYLHLPLPDSETLERLLQGIGGLLERLR